MRVGVTGGRDFTDYKAVNFILSAVHRKRPITLLIHGDAAGADTLSKRWAIINGVPHLPFSITKEEWARYPGRAGNMRNCRMLREGKPQILVAFPGNSGTRHMMRITHEAGVPVLQSRKFLPV